MGASNSEECLLTSVLVGGIAASMSIAGFGDCSGEAVPITDSTCTVTARSRTVTLRSQHKGRVTADRKHDVFQAAAHLFQTKGINATTVEDITTAAGIAKGNLLQIF